MKDKKNIILCFSLVILLIFTMLLFFGIGDVNKSGIQICSIIFILITELLVFGNIILFRIKKFNAFLTAGLSSTLFIYTLSTLIFNVFLLSIFKTIKGILIFNFSLLLIYLFISTMIFLFKKEN